MRAQLLTAKYMFGNALLKAVHTLRMSLSSPATTTSRVTPFMYSVPVPAGIRHAFNERL